MRRAKRNAQGRGQGGEEGEAEGEWEEEGGTLRDCLKDTEPKPTFLTIR